MKDRTVCHCENPQHSSEQEAVGCIHLIDLDDDPQQEGYKVCPACVSEFVVSVCLDRSTDLRLAFRIHPVVEGEPCPR